MEIHARINAAEATLTKHIESLGGVPEELKEAFALVTPALTQKLKILREAFQRSSVRMFQGHRCCSACDASVGGYRQESSEPAPSPEAKRGPADIYITPCAASTLVRSAVAMTDE